MARKRKAKKVDVLPTCKYVDLEEGIFRVFEDGTILRKKEDYYVEPPQNRTSRNGKYMTVTATIKGKQKNFYVHRLLGEAFVANPLSKPHINHKDGNPENNNIDNLEWVTPSENSQHAVDTGLVYKPEHYFDCEECGERFRTHTNFRICATCRSEEKNFSKRLENHKRKVFDIRKEFENVEFNLLDEKYNSQYKMIAVMRFSGLTYQEVGDYFGISRERVRQVLKRIIDEDVFYEKNPKPRAKAATSENPIVRARYFKGMTLSDISYELDRSVSYYSKREVKPELFTVYEANKICELLDLDFKEIFLARM